MSEDKDALIRYRLKEARESIDEARVLLNEGMSLRSVINRLYYAMFYAVLAVLQEKSLGTSKHSGAISYFDREFVKTGVFDKNLSKVLHRAFELRQKGDYMELHPTANSGLESRKYAFNEFHTCSFLPNAYRGG